VARSTVPGHADNVPPLERLGSRLLPPLAILTTVAAAVALHVGALGEARFTPAYLWGAVGAWLAYAAVAGLVFAELLARRILRAGQPAATTTDLAWNDALRAQALRDLATAPIMFGFTSILVTFLDVGSLSDYRGAGAPAAAVGFALLALIATVGCVLLVTDLVSKPQQHYWRRLGPIAAPVPEHDSGHRPRLPGRPVRATPRSGSGGGDPDPRPQRVGGGGMRGPEPEPRPGAGRRPGVRAPDAGTRPGARRRPRARAYGAPVSGRTRRVEGGLNAASAAPLQLPFIFDSLALCPGCAVVCPETAPPLPDGHHPIETTT
jgi:hypothetical protein